MTVEEAKAVIEKTKSPYLKRDMQKFIQQQKRKGGEYAKAKKRNRSEDI